MEEERLKVFLHSLDSPNAPYLNKIEKEARRDKVPIIRQDMQSFLQVFLELKKPGRILEVGTATGFSALLMASYTPAQCRITTIEKYDKRIVEARKNFASCPGGERITLLEGDAEEILKQLGGTYDFVFMDAAKGQYIHFLPDILRLLPEGGVLISDNVLQEGDILESHYAVERRNRTIYKRMRDYLYTLKHHPDLITSVLPVGDGAAVSVKAAGRGIRTAEAEEDTNPEQGRQVPASPEYMDR